MASTTHRLLFTLLHIYVLLENVISAESILAGGIPDETTLVQLAQLIEQIEDGRFERDVTNPLGNKNPIDEPKLDGLPLEHKRLLNPVIGLLMDKFPSQITRNVGGDADAKRADVVEGTMDDDVAGKNIADTAVKNVKIEAPETMSQGQMEDILNGFLTVLSKRLASDTIENMGDPTIDKCSTNDQIDKPMYSEGSLPASGGGVDKTQLEETP